VIFRTRGFVSAWWRAVTNAWWNAWLDVWDEIAEEVEGYEEESNVGGYFPSGGGLDGFFPSGDFS